MVIGGKNMKVNVPSVDPPEVQRQHNYFRKVLTIEISDWCPVCRGPRGKPYETIAFDGSIRMHVDGWDNPCGHLDKYAEVIEEAAEIQKEPTYDYKCENCNHRWKSKPSLLPTFCPNCDAYGEDSFSVEGRNE